MSISRDQAAMSVAVVGMAGRFPGAGDVETFWRNLRDGIESITFFDDGELEAGARQDHPSYVKAAGVIAGEDLFDAAFFDLSPREAEITDPQQRLLLETAWQALEDAACDPQRFDGSIGVFAGVGMNMYFLNNVLAHPEVFRSTPALQVMIASDKDYVASRVAYKLDLRGPAVCVQSACSTSLVAVHLACQSLQDFHCDLALAGGATVRVPQRAGYWYQEGGIFSPDGHCRAFDAGAAGTVSSSGVGVVALKRYEDALTDGDRILAVIRGTAVNNDGNAKVGFTAPSVRGQVEVISEALAAAGVDPATVGYVETHGTGTTLGDPIEVAALARAFDGDPRRAASGEACALGSVKSNVGHLDTAAGVAGLIKAVQALRHRQIPPSLHFETPHPDIDFASTPFCVAKALADWPANGVLRRAGVSSFGIGGTNAHVVLEEAPEPEKSGPSRPWQLLLVSARSRTALESATDELARHLEEHPEQCFADVCYTAQVGRRRFEHRRVLLGRDREDALAALRERDPERLLTRVEEGRERPVAFLFPGQGAQYAGMAEGLYLTEDVYRREVDQAAEMLEPHLGLDLRKVLFPPPEGREEADRRLRETALTQPALFVVEHALARLLEAWGVEPGALLGHSIGEYVAATISGVMTLEHALALVAARGRLVASVPAGAMLSVALDEDALASRLAGGLALAAANAADLQVVSGPEEAVAELERELAAEGVEARRLRTSHAFHSAMMDPVLGDFAAEVVKVDLRAPEIPIVSNLTGTWLTEEEATDPDYWVRHLRHTVRFADGIRTLGEEPARALLEVGPGRTLATLARRHEARPRQQPVLGSMRHPGRDDHDLAVLLGALGRLWLLGVEVDWDGFAAAEERRRLALPSYPFERRRFWLAARRGTAPAFGTMGDERPDEAEAAAPEGPGTAASHERPDLAADYVAPRTAAEERLVEIWRQTLGLAEVGVDDDFFELGGHSLLATRISGLARQAFQVDVPMSELFEKPTVAAMAAILEQARDSPGDAVAVTLPDVVPDPENRHRPFPLTDVQQAYWIGRDPSFELGGVATHVYTEILVRGVDLEAVTRAWRRLVERHDMLRAVVLPDGRQRILPEVPPYEIEVLDLRTQPAGEAEAALAELRRRMSQQVLPADRWPLFEVCASRLDDETCRLHVSFDMLIGDAWSWEILTHEFARLYTDPGTELEPIGLSFRDYVLAVSELESSLAFARDLDYWTGRLDELPGAPELPLTTSPRSLGKPRFRRLATFLERDPWERLKKRAATAGLTASGLLLAAFAEVLTAWSKTPRFALNLTLFNRLPIHRDVDALIGDFTSLTLLAVDNSSPAPFVERARRLQRQLWEDLDHRLVSAVRVLRELARRQGAPAARAMMPVVFTSTLNMRRPESAEAAGGERAAAPPEGGGHGISQTPQVWIDHQVTENRGALLYNWDVVGGLFPEGLLEEMFDAYTRLLVRLADDEAAWGEEAPLALPPTQLEARGRSDAGARDLPAALLHLPFQARAAEQPGAPAVITAERTLSYDELARRAHAVALELRRLGARRDRLAAVVMEKGWEQVAAVLGTLEAGAAYLPIDASLPARRRHDLLADGEATIALTQGRFADTLDWPDGLEVVAVDRLEPTAGELAFLEPSQSADDLAYVIFTSGSTGRPKGVMIEHGAAWNTVADVNARFGVGPSDRVLAVSALHFDLSVYDVFGLLAAGAAIVLPDRREGGHPDPAAWSRAMVEHGVTLWNSVPALLELVVDYADGDAGRLPESLRLVMLSGDWIPVALPDRLRALRPAQVVSLGGATEASIWSILHPVGEVDPRQPSIPYGKAMWNQTFHVLDHRLDPRPTWVTGELWIGGAGLARGYWRDAAKTAERFVVHPHTGERLYRTGDLGRYLPDGNIQFLGREDFQVKIRGYRVELGEIEAALDAHAGVRESVVSATAGPAGEKRLVACFTAAAEPAPGAKELRAHLHERLPEYMVPAFYLALESWPLTANGKIDRKALPAPEQDVDGGPRRYAPPATATEERLVGMCRAHLGVERLGIDDDFFELGGDSLMATRLVFQLRKELDVELPVRSFFDAPSVRRLAELVDGRLAGPAPEKRARRVTLARRPDPAAAPLSFAQERLWRFAVEHPESHLHNLRHGVHLEGELDPSALAWALGELVRRHEVFRTRFVEQDGRPVARIAPPRTGDTVAPALIDLAGLAPERRRGEAARLTLGAAAEPFDLARGPLFRSLLLRLEPRHHVLILVVHHIVIDGWSLHLLDRELAALYGRSGPLPELTVRYGDFAHWQRERAATPELRRQLDWWTQQLGGCPEAWRLPFGARRPAVRSFREAGYDTHLPAAFSEALAAFAREQRTTLFVVVLAAFAAVLHRLTGQDDLVIGTPAAGRAHEELDPLVGLFVNLLALRADLSGDPTFRQLVARLRETTLAAYDHQEVAFETITSELGFTGDARRAPLVQVIFNLPTRGSGRDAALAAGELVMEPFLTRDVGSEFDLSLYAVDRGDGLAVHFGYDADLFLPQQVEGLSDALRSLVEEALRDPGKRLSEYGGE